jgi:uncharacterized membrane protein YhhN
MICNLLSFICFFIFVPFRFIFDSLGNLKIPVFIFSIPLISMNVFSLCFLYFEEHILNNAILLIGTVSYLISDLTLICSYVKIAINHHIFYIILSYIIAQGCIIYSLLKKKF